MVTPAARSKPAQSTLPSSKEAVVEIDISAQRPFMRGEEALATFIKVYKGTQRGEGLNVEVHGTDLTKAQPNGVSFNELTHSQLLTMAKIGMLDMIAAIDKDLADLAAAQ